MNDLAITFLIGVGVAAILAWPIYKGLIAMRSRQTVSQHVAEHAHKQGTPTMGGLIILAGALPAMLYWGSVSGFQKIVPTLVLVIGYALIGFFDDFVLPRVKKGSRGFGWIPKLGLQVGIAALAVWLGQPLGTGAFAFSVFLILFFSNAYNFSDGLDWLSGSIFLALGSTLMVAAFRLDAGVWAFPIVAFLGALIPFMFLNRPPAKVFMGDVGSMAIGGLIGQTMAGLFSANNVTLLSQYSRSEPSIFIWLGLVAISIVMIIELVPPPLQILSVKLFKRRLFPFTPIHHAFQRAGWPEPKIVALFFCTQVVGSGVGFWLMSMADR